MPKLTDTERAWRSITKECDKPISHGYLPINLSLEDLQTILDKHYKGERKYNLQRALSLLTTITIFRYNTVPDARKASWYAGYVNINAKHFIKWVGTNYTDYIDALIKGNVIETDNCYIVGLKAKAYRFTPYYITPESFEWRKFYQIPYTEKKLLIQAYQQRINKNVSVSGRAKLNAMNAQLSKCIDMVQVKDSFDSLAAEHGRSYHFKKVCLDEAFIQLERIANCESTVFNERDEFGFRYHTPYTSLPSELRRYIRINGKEATEVDFKNSNAFYFATIAKHPEAIIKLMGTDCDKNVVTLIGNYYRAGAADFVTFVDKALSGELYEYLTDTMKLRGKRISRCTAKKIVMKFMNSDVSQYVQLKSAVSTVLPTVVKLCGLLNVNKTKTIPRLLQRVEASIIIDKIAVPLTTETTHSFTTVHDSFLCSEEDADTIIDKIHSVHADLGLTVPVIGFKRNETI